MPITKIIEDNAVKDIQEVEDHRFNMFTTVLDNHNQVIGEQAIDDIAANGAGGSFEGTLQRGDLIKLFKNMDGTRRRLDKVLMNEVNWDRWHGLSKTSVILFKVKLLLMALTSTLSWVVRLFVLSRLTFFLVTSTDLQLLSSLVSSWY